MNTPVAATSALQKKEITDISSMLLPLDGQYMLLPGVSVAEIVTFIPPESEYDEETPPWFLGHVYWRNQRIPLVSYEAMLTGQNPAVTGRCRIAVMNNTGVNHQLSFYALLLQGTPRLLRITSEDVVPNNEKIIADGEKMHVQVAAEEAVVPDLSFIERTIVDYLELT